MVSVMEKSFEFKNDKYDIIGFYLSKRVDQYSFEYILGDQDELCWGFNINGKLIGVSSYENYPLDSYSALVNSNELYILSDFDLHVINLDTLERIQTLDLEDYAPLDEIHNFYNGEILIGENDIIYIENNKIIWTYNSRTYIQSAVVFKDDTIEVIEDEPYNKFILDKNGNKI